MAKPKDKKNTNSGSSAASSGTPTKSRSKKNINPGGSSASSGTTTKPQDKKNTNPSDIRVSSNAAKIITTMITTLGVIIAAILACPAVSAWGLKLPIFIPTPIPPTATPVPFAQIQSLEVRKGGDLVSTLNPGESIDLATGGSVIAKVIIITNTDLDDLLFSWEFCRLGNNAKGQGAIEIPYLVAAAGEDCINIKIERGGVVLDTARFFLHIN